MQLLFKHPVMVIISSIQSILLLILLLILKQTAGDCNFQKYYQNQQTGEYPNTKYCTDRQDTWTGGTVADKGGCFHWSNGLVKGCTCTCAGDGAGDILRKCVNSFDLSTNACYANTVDCDACSPGSERRECGCDGNTEYHACSGGICSLCPIGKFSLGGKMAPCTSCKQCPPGQYETAPCFKGDPSAVGLDTACTVCDGGYYCEGGNHGRTLCPVGSYCPSNTSMHKQCYSDTSAMYCVSAGLTAFTLGCGNGYRYESNIVPIVMDPELGTTTGSQCIACDKGKTLSYQLLPHSATACIPCAAGSYAPEAGASRCNQCATGKYSSGIGIDSATNPCMECPKGTYASIMGASACLKCVSGKYRSITGAISVNMCLDCDAGTYTSLLASSACTRCSVGMFSSAPASSVCMACPSGKTTYVFTYSGNVTSEPHLPATSETDCRFCPNGFYACELCRNATKDTEKINCQNAKCSSDTFSFIWTPCVPCTPSIFSSDIPLAIITPQTLGLYFCPNGVRTLRTQPNEGYTFMSQPALRKEDDNIVLPCSVCGAYEYISMPCTLTKNTQCSVCTRPSWLISRIVKSCSARNDTVLALCNSSSGDYAPGKGRCNPCPEGALETDDDGCVLCPSGSFCRGGKAIACPAGTISGPGASRCTPQCSTNNFAPDGIQCIPLENGPTRVVAEGGKDGRFDGGAALPTDDEEQGFAMIQNFMAAGRGTLWRIIINTNQGDMWNIGGDASQPASPDNGAVLRFGRIGTLWKLLNHNDNTNDNRNNQYVLTEPDLGIMRLLVYDGEAFISTSTLAFFSNIIIRGEDIAEDEESGALFVADASSTNNCVWRIKSTLDSARIWRGNNILSAASDFELPPSTLVLAPSSLLQQYTSLLFQPRHVAIVINPDLFPAFPSGKIGLVMDSRAIWAFDLENMNGNLMHVCGNPLLSPSPAVEEGMSTRVINLAKAGVCAMTASSTMVVLGYYQHTNDESGILVFYLRNQPSLQTVRKFTTLQDAPTKFFWSGYYHHSTNSRLFVVSQQQVIEVGITGQCMCNEGLYCLNQQCVVAPVGTYAAAWSAAPLPCPKGTAASPHSSIYSAINYDNNNHRLLSFNAATNNHNNGACSECPLRPSFTTHNNAALNCKYSCSPNEVFSDIKKRCVPGCNISNGEYLRMSIEGGGCGLCPLGSGATGGGIAGVYSGCPPCPSETFGISPGICAPCASALFAGTVMCTLSADPPDNNNGCQMFFNDGVGGYNDNKKTAANNNNSFGMIKQTTEAEEGCFESYPHSPPNYFFLIYYNTNDSSSSSSTSHNDCKNNCTTTTTTASNNNDTYNQKQKGRGGGMVVTDKGTLFMGIGNMLWRAPAATGPLKMTQIYVLPFGASFDLIEVTGDEKVVLYTAIGATCVRQLKLDANEDTILAGVCHGSQGNENGATELLGRLEPIYDMALMISSALGQVLFISTMGDCAAIRTVSLYDGKITTFASTDDLRMPQVPLFTCLIDTLFFKIAIPRGTSDIYYASGRNLSYVSLNHPEEAGVELTLAPSDSIQCICASASLGGSVKIIATNPLLLRVMVTDVYGASLPTTIINVSKLLLLSNHSSSRNTTTTPANNRTKTTTEEGVKIIAIGCAGQRVWIATKKDELLTPIIHVVALNAMRSQCLAGFYYFAAQNMCVPVPVGTYTTPYSLQVCKNDTYGECQDCPDGYVSGPDYKLACQPCPFLALNGKCVDRCPMGTYRANKTCRFCPDGSSVSKKEGSVSKIDCTACQPGTFSQSLLTDGLCISCPSGQTSGTGSYKCVPICQPGACASDGTTCMPLTEEWQVITSVAIGGGAVIYAAAVAPGGDVFFTDGDGLLHFFDDCPANIALAEADDCIRNGFDLLPPKCSDGCRRGLMGLAVSPTFADLPQRTIRLVYAVSVATHNVYRFPILYKSQYDGGGIDQENTRQLLSGNFAASAAATFAAKLYYYSSNQNINMNTKEYQADVLSGIEGWRLVGGGRSGFADGMNALFNTPADIELLSSPPLLYISDFMNNRIRVVSLINNSVSTILGNNNNAAAAAAWKFSPQPQTRQPLGIGLLITSSSSNVDASSLLVAMNSENMLGILKADGTFLRYCALIYSRADNTGLESCILSTNSRSCMLNRPYDVLSAASGGIYVAVANGITRIDSNTLACQQIGGFWWDFTTKSRGWRDGKLNGITDLPDSLFDQPFKLTHDPLRGILYIVDLNNGALRRVFINGQCNCPPGSFLIEAAQACYNPSQPWNPGMRIQCPGGQFALDGDTVCRDCDGEAAVLNYGLAASTCTMWKAQTRRSFLLTTAGFSYARVLGQPQPPGSIASDWYGKGQPAFAWDDIFRLDSPITYSLSSNKGHAPWGGEFLTLTFDGMLWDIETDARLQPRRLLPGFWYPCDTKKDVSSCQCSMAVAAFSDGMNEEEKGWHGARLAAFRGMGQALGEGANLTTIAGPPWPPKNTLDFYPPLDTQRQIALWSRFMILGNEGVSCGKRSGPCFSVFYHLAGQQPLLSSASPAGSKLLETTQQQSNTCAVGWPAHYSCPQGYTWVAPNSSALMDKILHPSIDFLPSNIACLSCLPGTFSAMAGSYRCMPCLLGMFASSIGATACAQCPTGKYADVYGASACANCKAGHWTYSGAQTKEACSPCAPGTGSCETCVPGQYQSQAAQAECIACAPGTAAATRNATTCLPCPPRTFQSRPGKAVCDPCPPQQFASINATACSTCVAPGCNLAVDGICGRGCGLNFYWDSQMAYSTPGQQTDFCKRCPGGTLNAFLPCAKEVTACWSPNSPGLYFVEGSSRGDSIKACPNGQGSNLLRNGCIPCAPGFFSINGSGCIPCGMGQYHHASGGQGCAMCNPGSFASDKGQSACKLCPPGNFSGGFGAAFCSACPPGSWSASVATTRCNPCAAGTWSSISGLSLGGCENMCATDTYSAPGATACVFCAGGLTNGSVCTGCGLGMYQNSDRKCSKCPKGLANNSTRFGLNSSACVSCSLTGDARWYASLDGDVCLEAPPGHFASPNAFNYTPCPIGTARGASQLQCTTCALGKWSYSVGQSECRSCPPGTFRNVNDYYGCVACPPRTFAPNASATACTTCPPGTDASGDSTFCENCPANTMWIEGSSCQPCPKNTISDPGSTSCRECPPWTVANIGGCSTCPPGSFMQYDYDDILLTNIYFCKRCPEGTQNSIFGGKCTTCTGKGYVPDANAIACVPCSPGFTSAHDGGSVCTPCPTGTSNTNGLACIPCQAGYFYDIMRMICAECPMGTYGSSTGQTACTPCPKGTSSASRGQITCNKCADDRFSSDTGAVECTLRKNKCETGEYVVVHTAIPEQDNECKTCKPCSTNSFTVLLGSNAWSGQQSAACLFGNTTDPGFRCILNDWKEGQYLSMEERAGFASPFIDGTIISAKVGLPCPPLSEERMGYVIGPTFACYIGCKYGQISTGIDEYITAMMISGGNEKPHRNIFFPRALAYSATLCTPCPLTTCGMDGLMGLYRPAAGGGCGPPCLLPSYFAQCAQSASRNNGCIGICNPPPQNAWTTGGTAVLDGKDACPWSCKQGYHISDDGKSCLDCNDVSVCVGNSVLVPNNMCTPESRTTGGVCKMCPFVEGGRPVRWNPEKGGCEYACAWNYFSTPNGCSQCTIYNNNVSCPPGTFRDVAGCRLTGNAPQCVGCSVPSDLRGGQWELLVSFTGQGGHTTDNCTGICNAGYHTILRSSSANQPLLSYVNDDATAYTVQQIACKACTFSDTVPCHGRCSLGYFRDRTIVSDTLPGACARCTTSDECGTGRYAPICNGTGTANQGCRDCPTLILQNNKRQFVPYYNNIISLIFFDKTMPSGICPMACAPNHMMLVIGECISCSEYTQKNLECAKNEDPTQIAPGQPRLCDFIYSHWNATAAAPWWETPKYTPSFLRGALSVEPTKRNGLCWACPFGMGLWPGETELCTLLPGFGEGLLSSYVVERLPIPSWGPDVYLTFQEPRPSMMVALQQKQSIDYLPLANRRRLLYSLPSQNEVAVISGGIIIKACPVGHYNDRALRQCASCPSGTSTYSVGATSLVDCKCVPGYKKNNHGGCSPCPINTFRGNVVAAY